MEQVAGQLREDGEAFAQRKAMLAHLRSQLDEERAEWKEQREALAQRRAEAEDEAESQVADLTEQLAKVSLALSTEREKQWSERAELEALEGRRARLHDRYSQRGVHEHARWHPIPA